MSSRWTPQDVEEEAGQGFCVCFCFPLVTDRECCNIQFFPLRLPDPGHRSGELNEEHPSPELALVIGTQGVTQSSGLHLTTYPVSMTRKLPHWSGRGFPLFPPLGKNIPTSSKAWRSGPSPSPETWASIISGQGASCHSAVISSWKRARSTRKVPTLRLICSCKKGKSYSFQGESQWGLWAPEKNLTHDLL